jgi:glycosyltransferase involved in cell wall biosynthesis
MIDSLYDLDVLYVLRKNAGWYVHGHSAGGTNPSLVEAMFFGRPIVAYDVVYNRETTGEKALYFKTSEDICGLLSREDLKCEDLRLLAEERYRWQKIAREYEAVY